MSLRRFHKVYEFNTLLNWLFKWRESYHYVNYNCIRFYTELFLLLSIASQVVRGTQQEISRKWPKNNSKAWIKLWEAILRHFGRLMGKNLSVPHSQQDWWKSSQQARRTYNLQPDLLGSFPGDECPHITGVDVVVGHIQTFSEYENGCSLRAKFTPSVVGRTNNL